MKRLLVTPFIVVCLLLSVAETFASTYYVAKTGNDSNSGTEASPFLTIEKGVTTLTAGDTLYIKNGTYDEHFSSTNDVVPNSTSWDNPVTISAYPGDSPILNPSVPSGTIYTFYFGTGDQYVILDGLTLEGSGGAYEGIRTDGSSNYFRFKNLTIRNHQNQGILLGGTGGNVEIDNIVSHDNGTSHGRHGIYIATSNNTIENSEFYNNFTSGIKLIHSDKVGNNIVRNNNTHDNPTGIQFGIETDDANNYVYNNLVHDNTQYGIELTTSLSHYYVYNNTIYNNPLAFKFAHTAGGSGPAHDIYIYNNIFFNNDEAINFTSDAFSNIFIRNNLFYWNDIDITDSNSISTQENNLFTNPLFSNLASDDYHLSEISPAIDSGLSVTEVAIDYDGVTRPKGDGYDIGAYEYPTSSNVASTGTTDSTSPTTTTSNTSSTISTTTGSSISSSAPTVKLTQTSTGNTAITSNEVFGNGIEFSGYAPANALVSITLTDSSGKNTPGMAKVGSDGTWSWTPPPNLKPGNYSATFLVQDKQGNTGSTTLKFTVDEKGEASVTESAQDSSREFVEIEEEQTLFDDFVDYLRNIFIIPLQGILN